MIASALLLQDGLGHPSWRARLLVLFIGLALCLWGVGKARNRSVLIPTLTLLLSVGGGVIAFALYPAAFNSVSYLLGITYPPVLYVLFALSALLMIILHVSLRISTTDERCRRLAQEIALLKSEGSARKENVARTRVMTGVSESDSTPQSNLRL